MFRKSGKLLTIDDPRLDPVWEECGRLGIPVSIHSTDPEAFFHLIYNENERYEELTEHPDWSFYGPQFPSKESILVARDRIFAKHPQTTFTALHRGELAGESRLCLQLAGYASQTSTSSSGRAKLNLAASAAALVNFS